MHMWPVYHEQACIKELLISTIFFEVGHSQISGYAHTCTMCEVKKKQRFISPGLISIVDWAATTDFGCWGQKKKDVNIHHYIWVTNIY